MPRHINQATLLGVCGNEIQLRTTKGGHPVLNVSVATTLKFTNKQGESQERVTWHKVVAWGQLATAAAQNIRKGDLVYAFGELSFETFTNHAGAQQNRTVIKAEHLVGMPPAESPYQVQTGAVGVRDRPDDNLAVFGEEEIPF